MRLSAGQWIAIVLLDFVIRAGVLTAGGVFFPMIVYALPLSLLHLAILAPVNYSVATMRLPPHAAIATILIVTNVVFVACFALFAVDADQSARLSACPSPTPTCTWLDGRVAWYGIRVFAKEAVVLVAINLICGLIILPFGRPHGDSRPDPAAPGSTAIFSVGQWIAIVLLDFVIRAGVLTVGGIMFPMMVFALPLSLLHLTVLALVNYAVEMWRLRRRTAIATILIVTNLVFVAIFALYEIDANRRGRVTTCLSPAPTCTWIEGRMTWYGARKLAKDATVLVAINLLCVLIVLPFGRRRSADSTGS